MKKSFLILAVVLMVGVIAGCNPSPTGPTPACSLCAQQTQTMTALSVYQTETAIANIVETATNVVVNTATATQISTEVVIVATATATTVVVATATFTSTVNPNIHSFYVTITGTQAGNVDVCVSKRLIGQTVTWTRQTYYMDATYSYVWTSTVIQVDSTTEIFHLDGICADQNVHIIVYEDGVVVDYWTTVTINSVFSTNLNP